jgi:hypothetical protein
VFWRIWIYTAFEGVCDKAMAALIRAIGLRSVIPAIRRQRPQWPRLDFAGGQGASVFAITGVIAASTVSWLATNPVFRLRKSTPANAGMLIPAASTT